MTSSLRGARVAILVHETEGHFWSSDYGLRAVAEAWRREGARVTLVAGPARHVPADVAVLHLDRTVIPAPYLALARRYPRVVNGAVEDIGKRRLSPGLAARRDEPGPVIVKTDRNSGGWPEVAALRRRGLRGRLLAAAWSRLPARLSGLLPPRDYPVFASGAEVPRWFFHDPRFVVQRLRAEREAGGYVLRRWTFLGGRGLHNLTVSRSPVVKAGAIVDRRTLAAPPEPLVALRRRLGFDYGKFDYGVVDGEVVVYDVNRTPSGAGLAPGELESVGERLAPGLADLLGGA